MIKKNEYIYQQREVIATMSTDHDQLHLSREMQHYIRTRDNVKRKRSNLIG